ncbi:hypothetical protein FIV42_08185 [Persicimonas caeni]|uniref:Uncharacterized protein n=1 Tax=Persicimonas caeni TaxID=2292766 RepID=A0A4Y6PRR0_PERCE|nr:hypothetical protein [Persicimonas caeni]QDG50707.1 hypothetical protein FIV42_08185 [Persicimonas caeni]QED31928.1 hypothetical protein FRD00_08180 [Persicimonas caeni]
MAAELVFTMFRLQLDEREQLEFGLSASYGRTAALRDVLYEAPYGESRWGTWTIGNVAQVDEFGYYFRLGRVKKERTQTFEDGKFVDVAFDRAPYTHAFLDTHKQVLGVARNKEVAGSTKALANRFCGIVATSETFKKAGFLCEAFQISDPKGLLTWIERADTIKAMWLTFRRPNAFDEEKDFRGPMKKTLKALKAKSGTAQFHGPDIDKQQAKEITQATAAGGNDATVRLRAPEEATDRNVSTKDTPAIVTTESVSSEESRKQFLARLRAKYTEVRGPTPDES